MIYLYVMCRPDRSGFHVGYSTDLVNAIEFYRAMPSIIPGNMPYLVYLEGYTNVIEAKNRFKEVFALTADHKKELVKTVNPDFIEFIPGVNVEI